MRSKNTKKQQMDLFKELNFTLNLSRNLMAVEFINHIKFSDQI